MIPSAPPLLVALTLHARQALHTQLVGKLIEYAYSLGYELTWGEAFRTPEQAAWNAAHGSGILHSLHTERLAVDLMLFKDGEYLTDPNDYAPLGVYWKSLHGLCRWGGDFATRDADHFSIEWEGRA